MHMVSLLLKAHILHYYYTCDSSFCHALLKSPLCLLIKISFLTLGPPTTPTTGEVLVQFYDPLTTSLEIFVDSNIPLKVIN